MLRFVRAVSLWVAVVGFAIGIYCSAANAGTLVTAINPATGNTYYLLEADTWTASQAEAVALGGNLVTVNDQVENDWVFSTFGDGGTRNLWIGLNDASVEGDFVWVSGETSGYRNWAGPEPNNYLGLEDYVQFYPFEFGNAWNDSQDDGWGITGAIYGVVEVAPIPEPNTALLLGIGLTALAVRREKR
jgi:hypothetical protein